MLNFFKKKLSNNLRQALKRQDNLQYEPDISLCLMGDFMLDSRIKFYLNKYGLMYPFENIIPVLKNYDIKALNLEMPVSQNAGKKIDKKFNFKGEDYALRMLHRAGIDFVSLANNHMVDFGKDIAQDTIDNLDKWNIKSSGNIFSPEYVIFKINNLKIGFLGTMDLNNQHKEFQEVCNMYDDKKTPTQIKKLKEKSDIVCVSIHWGIEGDTKASPRQKELAKKMIDAGADIIWGHHPHVIQEVERYKNGVIFYSLGNFIFSHLTPSIKIGMLAGLCIKDKKITGITEYIINNDNYKVEFQPKLVKKISRDFLSLPKIR
jgi:poly-gamma-glutamate synthesis protein (capsule biosynthesis protein)